MAPAQTSPNYSMSRPSQLRFSRTAQDHHGIHMRGYQRILDLWQFLSPEYVIAVTALLILWPLAIALAAR